MWLIWYSLLFFNINVRQSIRLSSFCHCNGWGQTVREESHARRKEEKKRKQENEKEMDAEGSSSQRKRSKFSDKPEVEVKVEVDAKTNSEVKTDEGPLKTAEKVKENGSEGDKMEENDRKKEPDAGDSQATPTSADSVIKTAEVNGTDHVKQELKDSEMAEAAASTERLVEVCW